MNQIVYICLQSTYVRMLVRIRTMFATYFTITDAKRHIHVRNLKASYVRSAWRLLSL